MSTELSPQQMEHPPFPKFVSSILESMLKDWVESVWKNGHPQTPSATLITCLM